MYKCRHCAFEYMTDEAVICPRCQAPKGKGNNFCPFCGSRIEIGASQEICMNCGVNMNQYGAIRSEKSKIVAGILGIFLGGLGIHNLYLGYIKKGVLQIVLQIIAWGLYIGCACAVIAAEFVYYSTPKTMVIIVAFFVSILLMLGIRLWSFIEAILILCGKIKMDGKGGRLN